MKIETTWADLNQIPWDAVFRAAQYYRDNLWEYKTSMHDGCYEWMRDTWGIDHGSEHIRIVDQQKYVMFLLRWA